MSAINQLIVEYNDNIVFELQPKANKVVKSILDIKQQIEKQHDYAVGSQLLSLENVLLPEYISLEDLRFKYGAAPGSVQNSKNTNQLNRPIKLKLTRPKGQVNLKVNVISHQRDPINFSHIVPGTISIAQLRQEILSKLPQEVRSKKNAQLVLLIKKKQLENSKYLFETLYERFLSDDDEAPERNNQRQNNASLRRATQVDKQLVQYSRQYGHAKSLQVQACLQFESQKPDSSMLSISIDFRFNLLHNIKKVNWKVVDPWYRQI